MAQRYEFDGIDGQEWIRDLENGSMYCSMEELALLLNNQYDSVEVLKKINAVLEKRVKRNFDAYAECNKKLAKLQQKYQKQVARLQQKLAEKEEEIENLTIENKLLKVGAKGMAQLLNIADDIYRIQFYEDDSHMFNDIERGGFVETKTLQVSFYRAKNKKVQLPHVININGGKK